VNVTELLYIDTAAVVASIAVISGLHPDDVSQIMQEATMSLTVVVLAIDVVYSLMCAVIFWSLSHAGELSTASVIVGIETLMEFVPVEIEVYPKLVVPHNTSTESVAAAN